MESVTASVPPAAQLVRDFVNTREPQTNEEWISTPQELVGWMNRHAGAALAPVRVSAREVTLARDLREGLRAVLRVHAGHAPDSAAVHDLNRALAEVPVILALPSGGEQSVTAAAGARSGLFAPLVEAIVACRVDGTWDRLKVCARDSCQWAFFDSSRNRSGRWCSMAGCGNHVKMQRAYAARKGRIPAAGSGDGGGLRPA